MFLAAFQANFMNFVYYLKYMGLGMLTIIIVMGVLIGVTVFLNWITNRKHS